MICPYCSREMEKGVIQSPHELSWQKKKSLVGRAELHEGAVVLAEFSFIKGSSVGAHLCRECQKVIIDLLDE